MLETQPLKFVATPEKGEVSAVLEIPPRASALLVLGHGAGSHLAHPLVSAVSAALHQQSIATFRFNYPYSELGRGMDAEPVRLATVRAAVLEAAARSELPLFAGGHSMSGRMASLAHSRLPLPAVRGIVFLAFPLHVARPETARARHLAEVSLPLLFISGTRDKMADPSLLQQVVAGLARATLYAVDTADHGFKVNKRRSSSEPVFDEIARVAAQWIREHAGSSDAR